MPDQRIDSRDEWSGANRLDLFRFIFASLVIFSHSFPLLTPGGTNAHEPLSRLTSGILTLGEVAVDAFFAISGFLVTKSWLKSQGPKDYLTKRITRIYPAFIVVILIQHFLVTPQISTNTVSAFRPVQLVLAAYQCIDLAAFPYKGPQPEIFANNPLRFEPNGSLWTIRYEFCCYILVLLVGLSGLFKRPAWIALALVGAIIWFASGFQPPWPRIFTAIIGNVPPWPRFLSFYLAGMLLFINRAKIPKSARLATFAIIGLIVSRFVPHGLDVSLPIMGTYILFWLAFYKGEFATAFASHGDFSYGIYLYGFLIQQLLVLKFPLRLSPLKLFAAAWPLSIVAGFLSWNGVEKHFLRRKQLNHLTPNAVVQREAITTAH